MDMIFWFRIHQITKNIISDLFNILVWNASGLSLDLINIFDYFITLHTLTCASLFLIISSLLIRIITGNWKRWYNARVKLELFY